MKTLAWVYLFCPMFVAAQGSGIDFLENTSWQKVLERAKVEDKYVFVDCYASWCGPCKWMEKHIYSNDSIGSAMNSQFLSVRIQMDSTQHDDVEIKNWYASAHHFAELYQINAYPTYLFFSPDGRVLHEDIGAMDMKNFQILLKTAKDPMQQYFTLLTGYLQGDKNYATMPYLAGIAGKLRQDRLKAAIAQVYIHQYLETLSPHQLWTKENLDFVDSYSTLFNSGDKLFQQYYRDKRKIDSIMDNPGYSDQLINSVVYKEEITPAFNLAMKRKSEPDWHRMKAKIEKEYNGYYAERNLLKGYMDFYRLTKKWGKYISYFIRWQQETYMPTIIQEPLNSNRETAILLNNFAWEVFQYSRKKKELHTAISWIDQAISMSRKPYADAMDTKANLLYKLGKKGEALILEKQCYNLSAKDKEIEVSLEKMKKGVPTWPLN